MDKIFRCPVCGKQEDFAIEAVTDITAYVNGVGEIQDSKSGDTNWDNDSPMRCLSCKHHGVVAKFFCKEV